MLNEYNPMSAGSVDVEISQNVNRGANFLDHYMPLWFMQVDNMRLNMYNSDACLLGQLFGHFQKGVHALVIADPEEYGFSADSICDNCDLGTETVYSMLTSLWNDEIDYRIGA